MSCDGRSALQDQGCAYVGTHMLHSLSAPLSTSPQALAGSLPSGSGAYLAELRTAADAVSATRGS